MKNVIIAAVALALAACGTNTDKPQFSAIGKAETFHSKTGSFELDYRFEYLSWYSNGDVARKIEMAMVSDFFGEEFVRTDPVSSSEAFDEFNAGIRQLRESGEEEFHWDSYLKMRSFTDVLNERIVVYTIERADYSGGAHGMETIDCFNYDLRTGGRVTLDSLFTAEGKEALADAIRDRILKDHNKTTWAELIEEFCFFEESGVLPIDNFQLTTTHITFIYNPYSVACYANGLTKVKLPLAELAGFRKDAVE